MTTNTPTQSTRAAKLLALVVAILGGLMLIIGIGTYVGVSVSLRAQNIKVATITADAPGPFAGQPVAGPITAMAQIGVIGHHVSTATGGRTFAQIPNIATSDGKTYNKDVPATSASDGQAHAAGSPLTADDAKSYAARITAQQGAWTQASLYVSVLAFGIAAAIAGLSIVIMLVGVALMKITGPQAVATAKPGAKTE